MNSLIKIYEKLITDFRWVTFVAFGLVTLIFSSQVSNFHLDASSDTLVLDGNKNLEYYEEIKSKYGSDDYLIITYSSKNNSVLDSKTIATLSEITNKIIGIKSVNNVISILNAPLVRSPKIGLSDFTDSKIISIENENFSNKEDVKKELLNHPIYTDVLISKNFETTSLLVNFDAPTYEDIEKIRRILEPYKNQATIYIGGVPMIVADSISYIDSDIKTFGFGVVIFIIMLLSISFRKARWVILPLVNSIVICVIMIGLLGLINWPVTVVSSNFISLLLIISISLSIHLIVKYEELLKSDNFKDHNQLVVSMVKSKFKPCFYTALTTIVAFISLIISDVKPIIDFGWMMVFGIVISFIVIFFLMPAILGLFSLSRQSEQVKFHNLITKNIYYLTCKCRNLLTILFFVVLLIGSYGISRLSVDNRFIDYFKESTEIFQGMKYIDENLGGTTPLEVIIDAPSSYRPDEYSDGRNYWYNSFILEDVDLIHDYLDGIEETGKVLSLSSSMMLIKELNGGQVDSFSLALIKNKISPELKSILLSPYLSDDGNQIRFAIRVYESKEGLNRTSLIKKIRDEISEKFLIHKEDIKINGMLVLYNDLLQSLFRSQILTIGAVFMAIGLMFLIVFRSLKVALIALVPNIIAAVSVLGLMGIVGISLDIMTITIAAISLGIAVDDTIHYIHRFLNEMKKTNDVWEAIRNSHSTIGKAIYLTTITITLGFSILALSNFVPTIYFGLLTGFSMIVALLADLILLPIVLSFFFKKQS